VRVMTGRALESASESAYESVRVRARKKGCVFRVRTGVLVGVTGQSFPVGVNVTFWRVCVMKSALCDESGQEGVPLLPESACFRVRAGVRLTSDWKSA
jgi:hypothetical protein